MNPSAIVAVTFREFHVIIEAIVERNAKELLVSSAVDVVAAVRYDDNFGCWIINDDTIVVVVPNIDTTTTIITTANFSDEKPVRFAMMQSNYYQYESLLQRLQYAEAVL